MVAADAGITFMPELAVLNEGTRKGVKYISCHSPEPSRAIVLVYRPGSPLRNRYERIAKVISDEVKSILGRLK
ncbi:hydrogen peroxide-inducible gene activator [Haemophilus influenzae]|nr:hydrogen peroxide-inducible gene activator [Haemophilus influenzae]